MGTTARPKRSGKGRNLSAAGEACPGMRQGSAPNISEARDCPRSASGKQGHPGRTATKGRSRPTRQPLQGAAESASARIND